MAFDLKSIEALAPDQASLNSASKLTKRSNWVRLEKNEAQALLWGECQGSGANPYRVMVDSNDHGYKCTCPSRKFPCKHSLALMWICATVPDQFSPAETPEWVSDWVGRRRKGAAAPAQNNSTSGSDKNIGVAEAQPETAKLDDPAAEERRQAAQRKRAGETQASITAGLDELDQWIADQLRLGLSGFVDGCSDRCRRISSRLVDAKAAALAGRIDELPAKLLALRNEERPEAAIRELGKIVLLTKAWRSAPNDAELKRLIATSETREQILSLPDALQIDSTWEVLGEKMETRRDGLISHSTWLLDLQAETPRFALLLDFYPASSGRRSNAFSAGDRLNAKLVFYPSRTPLRAFIVERNSDVATPLSWPQPEQKGDPLTGYLSLLDQSPWLAEGPVLLPAGAILRDDRGEAWWQAPAGMRQIALPIAGDVPEPILGMDLHATAALWDGMRLELLAATSNFGRLDLA